MAARCHLMSSDTTTLNQEITSDMESVISDCQSTRRALIRGGGALLLASTLAGCYHDEDGGGGNGGGGGNYDIENPPAPNG